MKKSEGQRVKEYMKRVLDVGNPRSLKDKRLIEIVNEFNHAIAKSWFDAMTKIDELK